MILRKILCKIFGHKWDTYPFRSGHEFSDQEQAGHCFVCGVDTHENDDSVLRWIDIIQYRRWPYGK